MLPSDVPVASYTSSELLQCQRYFFSTFSGFPDSVEECEKLVALWKYATMGPPTEQRELVLKKIEDWRTHNRVVIQAAKIFSLPNDVIEYIFSFLSIKTLMTCCLVCKYWKERGNSPILWKMHLHSYALQHSRELEAHAQMLDSEEDHEAHVAEDEMSDSNEDDEEDLAEDGIDSEEDYEEDLVEGEQLNAALMSDDYKHQVFDLMKRVKEYKQRQKNPNVLYAHQRTRKPFNRFSKRPVRM
jgi:hypothetical protein